MSQANARRWKSLGLRVALAPLLIWGGCTDAPDELAGVNLLAAPERLNAVGCGPEIDVECISSIVRVTSVNVSARTFTGVVGTGETPVTFTATPATRWFAASLSAYPPHPIIPALRSWNTLIAQNPHMQNSTNPSFAAMLAHAANIVKQSRGTAYFAITANPNLTLASVQPVPPPR